MIIEFSSFLLIIKSFNLSLNLNVKNNLLQPVYSVHISVMYSEYVYTKILSVYVCVRIYCIYTVYSYTWILKWVPIVNLSECVMLLMYTLNYYFSFQIIMENPSCSFK